MNPKKVAIIAISCAVVILLAFFVSRFLLKKVDVLSVNVSKGLYMGASCLFVEVEVRNAGATLVQKGTASSLVICGGMLCYNDGTVQPEYEMKPITDDITTIRREKGDTDTGTLVFKLPVQSGTCRLEFEYVGEKVVVDNLLIE